MRWSEFSRAVLVKAPQAVPRNLETLRPAGGRVAAHERFAEQSGFVDLCLKKPVLTTLNRQAPAGRFFFLRTGIWHVAIAILLVMQPRCVQSTDPGMAERYNPEFTSPTAIVGKRFHWTGMPVKLRYNACSVSGCSSAVEDAVKRGIEFWQKNATLYGEIQTEYGEPAAVSIVYTTALSGNVIGVCSASLAQNTQTGQYFVVTPLTLTIATTTGGQPIDTRSLEFVAAHEMGHCLGLWDHSPTDGDLMYAYLTQKTSYSPRDLNTLRWLYSQKSNLGAVASGSLSIATAPTGLTIQSPPLQLP